MRMVQTVVTYALTSLFAAGGGTTAYLLALRLRMDNPWVLKGAGIAGAVGSAKLFQKLFFGLLQAFEEHRRS